MSDSLRVFVTGGTKGIGHAVALRFARAGARVAIAARTSADLDSVVSEIEAAGGQGEACQANLRDHGSLEAAVFRAVDFFDGSIDVLVNCAGLVEFGTFEESDLDTWERFLSVNLTGPFHVLGEALPALRESSRAHVFNIGAALAEDPPVGSILMAATKAGIDAFGRALGAELESESIRVTTVLPRLTDTPGLAPWKERFAGADLLSPDAVADAIWDAYHSESVTPKLHV
ncbi:MAG: SDR family oxidoreductase [Planctomycetota bacterium]